MSNECLETIQKNLSDLKLKTWVDQLQCDWEKLTPNQQKILKTYLEKYSTAELSHRRSESIRRKVATARFIRHQTVDQYDFEYNSSTKKIKNPYLKLYNQTLNGQIPRAVFVGNTGLGKTHLARALGYAACQSNQSTAFTKASAIINNLATAKAAHNLENEIKKYRRPRLLIIDELGYVTLDIEEGNLFFQVISDRHDRGLGTIVTTNFVFSNWNQIFASQSTAVVTVERLTAEAEVFYLEGESYAQQMRKKRKN